MLRQSILLGLAVTIAEAAVAGLPDLSGLPQCASSAAVAGIGATGCQLTDLACICANPVFIKAVGTQIAASCNAEDQKKALTFANSICQQNGVTVPSDGLAVSSAAAAAEAPAATEAASGSGGEEAKEVPSASETVAADATETGAAETTSGEPPYPVPTGNGTNSTSGSNSTSPVAPFAGAGSRSGIAVQGVLLGLMVAGGSAVL